LECADLSALSHAPTCRDALEKNGKLKLELHTPVTRVEASIRAGV